MGVACEYADNGGRNIAELIGSWFSAEDRVVEAVLLESDTATAVHGSGRARLWS